MYRFLNLHSFLPSWGILLWAVLVYLFIKFRFSYFSAVLSIFDPKIHKVTHAAYLLCARSIIFPIHFLSIAASPGKHCYHFHSGEEMVFLEHAAVKLHGEADSPACARITLLWKLTLLFVVPWKAWGQQSGAGRMGRKKGKHGKIHNMRFYC